MGYASTGPYHLTACPHCEELICVREVTPAAGLRAVMSAFDAHLAASVTCKAAQDARPTLAESLVALGEALGPEGAEAMFPREDDVIETLPVNEMLDDLRGALEAFNADPTDDGFATVQQEQRRIMAVCEELLP